MLREMTEKESTLLFLLFIGSICISILITKFLNNKMSNKVKVLYMKILVSIGIVIIGTGGIIYLFLRWFYNREVADRNLWGTMFGILGLSISSFGCSMSIFGTFQKAKPQRYQLKQDNYEEYSNYLAQRVKEFGYELNYELEKIKFYKKEIKRKIYFIIDVKVEELTEDVFNELYNNKIFPNIEEEFEKMKNKGNILNVIMIISVDRITPFFYKYIESEDLDKRFYKYPVGISFGSNQIYINGEEPIGYNPCKKLKQELEIIMEIKENKSSD